MSASDSFDQVRYLVRPAPPVANDIARIRIVPLADGIGAEIRGLDLSQPLSEDIQALLRHAWQAHLVLLLRDQYLDAPAFLAAASVFGRPQEGAHRRYQRAGGHQVRLDFPEIMVNSNLGPDGLPALENDGLGSTEVQWHSDNSYIEAPPVGSMLYALEAPADSGMTAFANQYLAFERLPESVRAILPGLRAKHDASRNSAGVLRPGLCVPVSPADVPGPFHPMVVRHAETGRRALYLGRRRDFPSQFIEGMSTARSEALLDQLWAAATEPTLTWVHRWRPGDVLLWDNRYAMHHRTPIDINHRRVMLRTQFQGEPPLAADTYPPEGTK